MIKKSILLVEDDKSLVDTIFKILSKEYDVYATTSVNDTLGIISKHHFDLYVIDIVLPGKDERNGLDICRYIRKTDKETPILFITGKRAINYKLGAFNVGGDDYLCKPFNLLELRARIKSLLKRLEVQKQKQNVVTVQDLIVERESKTVRRGGKVILLRRKEYELLEYFLLRKGCVFSRDELIDGVWKNRENGLTSNTIDVHIKNLRNKIDKSFNTKLIKTVYGMGYKIE